MRKVLLVFIIIVTLTSCAATSGQNVSIQYDKLDLKTKNMDVYLTNDSLDIIVNNLDKEGARILKSQRTFALLEDGKYRYTVVPNDFNDEYKWAIIKTKK